MDSYGEKLSSCSYPFRMADYRLRLHRKFPEKEIQQFVIYLTRSDSPLVFQTSFEVGKLTHEFNVIRLWEQPTEIFQQYPELLPLAVLTQTNNRIQTLTEVAKQIDNIEDRRIQSNISAATAIISGLALKKEIIQRLLRSEIMRESEIYQEILQDGEAKGIAKGEAKGKAEGEAEEKTRIALNMLHSGIAIDLIAQLTGLSLEQIQKLR